MVSHNNLTQSYSSETLIYIQSASNTCSLLASGIYPL